MGIIGVALAESTIIQRVEGLVPANTTLSMDLRPLADLKTITYQVFLSGDSPEKAKTFYVRGYQKNGVLNHSITNKKGDTLAYSIKFEIIGSEASLTLINQEAFDIGFCLVRVQF